MNHRMVDRTRIDSRTGRTTALAVLLGLTLVGEFLLLEQVWKSLMVGLLVTSAVGFFLMGAVFGAGGYVAAAIPMIAFFLLGPLSLLGAPDSPATADGQVGLVPFFLSLYAAGLVAAGHAVRHLWLGARRLRGRTAWKRKPEKPFR
jgi:hypothetical protein